MTEQIAEAPVPAAPVWEKFYDSCAKVYPATATKIAVYGDDGGGPPECTGFPPDPDKYLIHSITREGGAEAWKAQLCDYEPGLNSYEIPGRLHDWAHRRVFNGRRAVCYGFRAELGRMRSDLGVLWTHPLVFFWISTLDNNPWTPMGLAADILANWHIRIDPAKIWANQYQDSQQSGGPWDTSNLFGTW